MIVLQILYLVIGFCLAAGYAYGAADLLDDREGHSAYIAGICLMFLFWPFALLVLYFITRA
jgi:hypothetical protein